MPRPTVAIAIPTTGRPDYLDVALRSVLPQARAEHAEVLVVDDGPSEETRAVAARHGVRVLTHPRRRGLNASRNAAFDATDAALVCLLDDDVAVDDGWLGALVDAVEADPGIDAVGGPVRPVLDGRADTEAERRIPPISRLVLEPDVDQDTDRLWGANLAVRRTAFERVGPFDPTHTMGSGDEEEWLTRLRAGGGRVRYVAAAGVAHRRTAADASTAALTRVQRSRGRAARAADARTGAPGIGRELRTLAGNVAGLARHRDAAHRWSTAHAAGRVHEALLGYPPAKAPDGPWSPSIEDAFSGVSGHVAGRRAHLLRVHDRWLDARLAAAGTGRALDRLAAATPRRRVLVVVPARPQHAARVEALRGPLSSLHHDVELRVEDPAGRARFAVLEQAHAAAAPADWLLVVDDDVALAPRFLDRFVGLLEAAGLDLAQPAHRRHGHAAWSLTRREPGAVWRETTFVEIGPVTAISGRAQEVLLPFPPGTGMGWGLDAHWAAVAAEHGWRLGVVDALPVDHTLAPAGTGYDTAGARADAEALLADRPHLPRWELRTVARHDEVPSPGHATSTGGDDAVS